AKCSCRPWNGHSDSPTWWRWTTASACGASPRSGAGIPQGTGTSRANASSTADARSRSPTARTAAALGGKNHLQQFIGIVEEVPEFVALRTQNLRGEVRGHLDSCHRGIFRHVANFVDPDAG